MRASATLHELANDSIVKRCRAHLILLGFCQQYITPISKMGNEIWMLAIVQLSSITLQSLDLRI